MKKINTRKGFTLIELLVVISIISLLSSIVFSSLNSARLKARNSKRTQDIEQLTNAFILGYDASNGTFPSSGLPGAANWVCISIDCFANWDGYVEYGDVNNFMSTYIKKPTDPAGNSCCGGYLYHSEWPGAVGYDGNFTAGIYFTWTVEPPITSTSCGRGRIFWTDSTSIQCMYKLD